MVNLNLSILTFVLVIVLTILAAAFRVTTAPERIRMRMDSAKASCLGAGGEWIKVDREELCRQAVDQKKT